MSWISKQAANPALRFAVLFFALVVLFNGLISLSWVQESLVAPYTEFITTLSAKTLQTIGYPVTQNGTVMRSTQFAVDIRRGCDGLVASVLLISACLAFPAAPLAKAIGVIGGYGLIFLMNLVRIETLFLLGEYGEMDLFNFVHTYVAQFAVIAFTMVFWLFWAGRQRAIGA